jgi:NADP-dependent 3-hydroxy acid dehydrogenase YdfG
LGAAVALIARRGERIEQAAAAARDAGGTAIAITADVASRAALEHAAAIVSAELGPADLVFANAGVMYPSGIDELRVDDWDAQIDTNVRGVMNTIAAFIGTLIDAGEAGRRADLLLTSSIAANRQLERYQIYSGTKAYVMQLARALRLELGAKGVRVWSVLPGFVATELMDHVSDPQAVSQAADLINHVKAVNPGELAETVAFVTALPPHVNIPELTILPVAQLV